jgi:hypothetical protein
MRRSFDSHGVIEQSRSITKWKKTPEKSKHHWHAKKENDETTVMTKLSNFAPCRAYLRSDALPPHSGDLSWLRLGQNLFCR